MHVIYFDCFAGASGDMILGALIDAGLESDALIRELAKLNLSGYRIASEKVTKNGISGTRVQVETEEQKAHRHLQDIMNIIDGSELSPAIKDRSKAVFQRLAEAEARVHNTSPDHIHFHEVGALDAIVDIVGAVVGLDLLGIEAVHASPMHVGTGYVDCQHGRIPVPSPATMELLRGIPVVSTGIEAELTTPTGAAILTTLSESFGSMPSMSVGRAGYGAGQRDLEIPNLLRVVVGQTHAAGDVTDMVDLIETNIDDMSPELVGHVSECLMKAGALDVYVTPTYMKKNRPGVVLSVITSPQSSDDMLSIIFAETTSIGVRLQRVRRSILRRTVQNVATKFGEVGVKVSKFRGKVVNISPEYEDCKRLAASAGIPVKQVLDAAKAAAMGIDEKE
ncbi:MAG: nickel pincer cofactor biosynthesis protein LarC [Candidatus Zixiibacteriota bacterium]|nr:MAG: nickel pincer cofactor biosynthesis protein LarC [candidate division Zixibacteria bacterium]